MCHMDLSAEVSKSGNDNYTQIAINKKFIVSYLQLFILLHLLNFTFGVGEQTCVLLCHSVRSSSSSAPQQLSLYSSSAPSEAPENTEEKL